MVDSQRSLEKYCFGLSLRPHIELTPSRLEMLANTMATFCMQSERPCEIQLYSFFPAQDDAVLKDFEAYFKAALTQKQADLSQFTCRHIPGTAVLKTIGECHAFYGMRFHSLVLALCANVPAFGFIYDPKVHALLKELGLDGVDIAQLSKLDPERLHACLHQAIPDLSALRARTHAAFAMLNELLQLTHPKEVLI
jgi:polysaccharide pyruvyl transferase WcaK-like protein